MLRYRRAMTILTCAALLLGACGAGTTTAPSPAVATAAGATATPVSHAGVTLALWRGDYDVPGIDAINAEFEKRTGAKVNTTKVPAPPDTNVLPKWAAGERPDILYLTGFASTMARLDAAKNLQSMNDFAFAKNVQPSLQAFGVRDGVRYWAPLTPPFINSMLYNKKVVSQLGLPLPTNAPQLLSFCDQAKAKGVTAIAVAGKTPSMLWFGVEAMAADYYQANPDLAQKLLAKTATFTDPEYVKRIQFLADAKARGCYPDKAEAIDFNAMIKMFLDDKTAFLSCGSNCVPDLLAASDAPTVNAKVGYLPISYTKPVVWANGGGHFGAYLPKTGDARREAAARAYIDFALGAGYELYLRAQKEQTRYPTSHPDPDPNAIAVPYQESLKAAQQHPAVPALAPQTPCSYGVPGALFTALAELFVGDKTSLQVAQTMDATFKQSCKDLGIAGF